MCKNPTDSGLCLNFAAFGTSVVSGRFSVRGDLNIAVFHAIRTKTRLTPFMTFSKLPVDLFQVRFVYFVAPVIVQPTLPSLFFLSRGERRDATATGAWADAKKAAERVPPPFEIALNRLDRSVRQRVSGHCGGAGGRRRPVRSPKARPARKWKVRARESGYLRIRKRPVPESTRHSKM